MDSTTSTYWMSCLAAGTQRCANHWMPISVPALQYTYPRFAWATWGLLGWVSPAIFLITSPETAFTISDAVTLPSPFKSSALIAPRYLLTMACPTESRGFAVGSLSCGSPGGSGPSPAVAPTPSFQRSWKGSIASSSALRVSATSALTETVMPTSIRRIPCCERFCRYVSLMLAFAYQIRIPPSVSSSVSRIPTLITVPVIGPAWIRSPTWKGRKRRIMNPEARFLRSCWEAKATATPEEASSVSKPAVWKPSARRTTEAAIVSEPHLTKPSRKRAVVSSTIQESSSRRWAANAR
mmetsp:Transcript_12227/g.29189  ORF Transcript_12227/g.29189 Transcript_12227/m.29189 type:complete len:295 (+) Transcript_12227:272-1156(+)